MGVFGARPEGQEALGSWALCMCRPHDRLGTYGDASRFREPDFRRAAYPSLT